MEIGQLVWKITGDDSGLTKSLRESNKGVLSLNEQMRRADNTVKIFGKDSDRLAARQVVLKNKIIELLEKGVDPSNKGLKKLTDQYNKNEKEIKAAATATAKYEKETRAAAAAAAKHESRITKLKTSITLFAAAAVYGFGRMIGSSVKASSDAEETANKFGVVFSSIQKDATNAAKNLQENFGLSSQASQKLLSDTGDLLTGFGFTQQEALKLSEQVNTLGADLASFTNYVGGTEGASEALTKALLGEAEQAKSLGIVINQNSKEYKDLVKRFTEVEGKTLQQAKAYAALELATTQSKNAIGDFARSEDSFANVSRKVNSLIEDQKALLGKELLPSLSTAGRAFVETAKDGGVFIKSLQFVLSAIGTVVDGLTILGLKLDQAYRSFQSDDLSQQAKVYLSVAKQSKEAIDETFGSLSNARKEAAAGNEEAKKLVGWFDNALKLSKERNRSAGDNNTAIENENKIIEDIFKNRDKESKQIDEIINKRKNEKNLIDKISAAEKNKNAKNKKLSDEELQKYTEFKAKILSLNDTELESIEKRRKDNLLSLEKFQNEGLATEKDAADLRVEINKKANDEILKNQKAVEQKKIDTFVQTFTAISSQVQNVLSSAASLTSQLYQNRIDQLDEQMQKEFEAAGVADQTSVEQAQKEYDLAVATSDALTIEEKRKQLDRAKIEEKFAKKRAKLEYEAALAGWQLQLASATIAAPLAVMNALTSGWAAASLNPSLAIWYPALLATLAGASAGLQIAAVAAAKPEPPKFATGGIIPGSTTGTNIIAGENNRTEAILNQGQMQRFMDIADGKQAGANMRPVNIDSAGMFDILFKASQNGELYIAEKALIK